MRQLLLPDISLVVQARGKLSSDNRDEMRNRLRLSEAEIGIQGYVYPKVKADAFITMSPAEDAAAQVEEAYLTYLGLRPRDSTSMSGESTSPSAAPICCTTTPGSTRASRWC